MALPRILASGKHDDLLGKSESEVFEIIESAVSLAALRWPKELLAQKHRLLKPLFTEARSPADYDGDDVHDAVSDLETKDDPTKVVCVEVRRDHNYFKSPNPSSGNIPTTTGTETETEMVPLFRGSKTEQTPASGKLEESNKKEDEYEKKLETCKRSLQLGYSQYTDSRKRSKVIAYIPVQLESNHDRLSNRFDQKKSAKTLSKALPTRKRSTLSRC